MPTTITVKSWPADPTELGPLYPFVGWEMGMAVVCLLVFVSFLAWKIESEKHRYAKEVAALTREGD